MRRQTRVECKDDDHAAVLCAGRCHATHEHVFSPWQLTFKGGHKRPRRPHIDHVLRFWGVLLGQPQDRAVIPAAAGAAVVGQNGSEQTRATGGTGAADREMQRSDKMMQLPLLTCSSGAASCSELQRMRHV